MATGPTTSNSNADARPRRTKVASPSRASPRVFTWRASVITTDRSKWSVTIAPSAQVRSSTSAVKPSACSFFTLYITPSRHHGGGGAAGAPGDGDGGGGLGGGARRGRGGGGGGADRGGVGGGGGGDAAAQDAHAAQWHHVHCQPAELPHHPLHSAKLVSPSATPCIEWHTPAASMVAGRGAACIAAAGCIGGRRSAGRVACGAAAAAAAGGQRTRCADDEQRPPRPYEYSHRE